MLLVDQHIQLRELSHIDVADIFSTIDSERAYLGEWLPFVEFTQEMAFTHSFVDAYLQSDRSSPTFVILFDNTFAGLIGLKDTDKLNCKTEIGYWLSEKYQGKGIVTRSAAKLIEYAFENLNINRIQVRAATGNTKSQRVAERLGFVFEGIERNGEKHARGYVDLNVYSLLKSEFKKSLNRVYIS
jgi:ribosomal-protein-serine acetyltransferase